MIGWQFMQFIPPDGETPFERLFKLFQELIFYTAGNVGRALTWLTELDRQHRLTDDGYGVADFIQELIDKGYIREELGKPALGFIPTAKMEIALRRKALEEIFGQLKKTKRGNHSTKYEGSGDELASELRPYEFGDAPESIAVSESLRNAYINHGIEDFKLLPDDLEVQETFFQSQTSTVLMIDVSHSMILYGEDRITPAKKVAMALSELITTRYPKDTLDIIAFGDDAWPIEIKDLPYLEVGEFHTNTVAGLELALEILRKRRNPNKQIFMITDGKPTCIKKGKKYYKNSYGFDRTIINRTLTLAAKCRKLGIPVTTFMIAKDPYLMHFVDQFTQINRGKAFFSNLEGLGEFVFLDYKNNKRKRK